MLERPALDGAADVVDAASEANPARPTPSAEMPAEALAPRTAVMHVSMAAAAYRPAIATQAPPPPIPGPGPIRARERGDADMAPAEDVDHGATAPQLRRFIKSRAYVPMHELRRRFGINGNDDDVTPVDIDRQRVFVGLPPREGGLLGELLRAGDIGYELSLDPIAPIVVGVYPMRPVPRS